MFLLFSFLLPSVKKLTIAYLRNYHSYWIYCHFRSFSINHNQHRLNFVKVVQAACQRTRNTQCYEWKRSACCDWLTWALLLFPRQSNRFQNCFVRFREHAVRSCSISLVHNGRMSDDLKPPVLFTKRCVRTRCTVISLFPFQNCDKIKLTAMEDRSYPNNFSAFRLAF